MLVCVLRLCLQNVTVSKSRHRLLFYPTRKGKKAQKNSFFEIFLGFGGQIIEREGVSTLSIRGYPRALRYLLIQNKINFFTLTLLFKQSFQKHFITLLRTEARVKLKFQTKTFFQTHKHKENNFENKTLSHLHFFKQSFQNTSLHS